MQEVLVGGDDRPVELELDDPLRAVESQHLALEIGVAPLLRGDVGGELHHLDHPAGGVADRVVGRLDPDLAGALAEAPELALLELAAPQRLPEGAVGVRTALARLDEHPMVLAAHLVEAVAEDVQEVLVGGQHRSVEIELDDALGAVEGRDLARDVEGGALLRGDVGGEHHHPSHPAGGVADGRVAGVEPDLAAVLADPPALGHLVLAPPQGVPECAIALGPPLAGLDEHRVVLARYLLASIAEHGQGVLVGIDDGPVGVERHDALRPVEGLERLLARDRADLPIGDVGRDDDDAAGLAGPVRDRAVGRLDPDLAAALADAPVLAELGLAAAQRLPEPGVGGILAVGAVDEEGVVPPEKLLQPVPHDGQETRIGRGDLPVEIELEDRLRRLDGVHARFYLAVEHRHDRPALIDLSSLTSGMPVPTA